LIFLETPIRGSFVIEQDVHKDQRGSFVKTFHEPTFLELGLECDFRESYYSKSREDVIRGMHFQSPPCDHAKLVTVLLGTIIDVLLDLRSGSPSQGQFFAVELSRENRKSIYIPRGVAHGFGVLSDIAIANYMVTTVHSTTNDCGIRFDSFGYQWPIKNPILSDRDLGFDRFSDYKSSF